MPSLQWNTSCFSYTICMHWMSLLHRNNWHKQRIMPRVLWSHWDSTHGRAYLFRSMFGRWRVVLYKKKSGRGCCVVCQSTWQWRKCRKRSFLRNVSRCSCTRSSTVPVRSVIVSRRDETRFHWKLLRICFSSIPFEKHEYTFRGFHWSRAQNFSMLYICAVFRIPFITRHPSMLAFRVCFRTAIFFHSSYELHKINKGSSVTLQFSFLWYNRFDL